MPGWLFAQGRDAEQTLGDVVAAGATTIALAGANGIFSVGEALFISESDATETEYLGAVKSVSPTDLDFSLSVRVSKNSGALLWRPVNSLNIGGDPKLPQRRRSLTGVHVERSLGGTVFAVQTGAAGEILDWRLDRLTPAQSAALGVWLDSTVQGGLAAFTLIAPTRELNAVRLREAEYVRKEGPGGETAFELNLLVEQAGGYR